MRYYAMVVIGVMLLIGCTRPVDTMNPKQGYAAFVFDLCSDADKQMEQYLRTKNQEDRLRAMDMQIQCTRGLTQLGLIR